MYYKNSPLPFTKNNERKPIIFGRPLFTDNVPDWTILYCGQVFVVNIQLRFEHSIYIVQ